MHRLAYLGMLIVAVTAVGIADVFLKKAAVAEVGFMASLRSPWMLAAIVLYLVQILLFTYIFEHGTKLSLVGIMQTGLYAIITLGAGILYFNETLTSVQIMGIIFTITGIILLNP